MILIKRKLQMKKQILCALFSVLATASVTAQVSSTLSPYSQFGLGVLADRSQGFNRGMGGVGVGLRDGKIVNTLNPASYSAVDSLSMIFDMGLSGRITNFKEGNAKVNRKTASFDYFTAVFRLYRKVGLSVGVLPYTNVGYNYSTKTKVGSSTTNTVTETHEGDGGLSEVYLGLGAELFPGFSVGANVAYLWGDYEHEISLVNSDTYANDLTKTYTATFRSYKLDFGVQWQHRLSAKNLLTVGATVGIGHRMGTQAMLEVSNANPQTSVTMATKDSIPDAFKLPFTFGLGVSLVHNNSLTVAADYTLQKWGSLSFPQVNSQSKYVMSDNVLSDRHQLAVGADWVPQPNGRKFLQRVHYKIGASYATSYFKVNGNTGPKDIGVSAGFGIPIVNSWNYRPMLNISASWTRSSAPGLITENTFRVNIGLTFNERWFAKMKVE